MNATALPATCMEIRVQGERGHDRHPLPVHDQTSDTLPTRNQPPASAPLRDPDTQNTARDGQLLRPARRTTARGQVPAARANGSSLASRSRHQAQQRSAPPCVATALAALDAADREASEEPSREPQAPDHGPSYVGLAAAVTIAAVFWVSGRAMAPMRAVGFAWAAVSLV